MNLKPSLANLKVPTGIVWVVIGVCVAPLILNLIGVDFGIPKPNLNDVITNLVTATNVENSPAQAIDVMHHTLLGSFTHTILEWSAVCTAIFIVILSFVHFNLNRDVIIPIVGVALFYAGCMDAFHTLAADRMIESVANTENLIPFTWALCRIFNALITMLGVGAFLIVSPKTQKWGIGLITGISLCLGLAAYGIIHICATSAYLPQTQFPDSLITRPWDLAPLILYLIAGIFIYPRFYQKYPSLFAATLILSVVPAVTTQLYMTFGSSALFDNSFNIAHFLKIVSYLVPLTGLSLDYIQTYQQKQAALDLLQDSELNLQAQKTELQKTLSDLQQMQGQLIQSEKMSSLGQLVAGVAHEINNPVNFIYGNISHASNYTQDLLVLIELYQKHYPQPVKEIQSAIARVELEFLTEDLPKLLTSIKVGADRIQKIVLSLRNFSRMDQSDLKSVDIHEGIDSTLLILQNRLKATAEHQEIKIIKKYGNLPEVECYAGQLNQVFMNILTNAIDALEPKRNLTSGTVPKIEIYTELVEKSQSNNAASVSGSNLRSPYVSIHLIDNGMGIPEDLQQKIFDPFFTTKPVGQGTGMGMSISYQIVTEKHGGRLNCISKLDEGTEFVIEIPLNNRI